MSKYRQYESIIQSALTFHLHTVKF